MELTNINDEENRKSYEKVYLVYHAIKHHMNGTFVENLLKKEGDINYKISVDGHEIPNLLNFESDQQKHHDLTYFLVDYGVDFTCRNEEGNTVLHRIFIAESEYDDDDIIYGGDESRHIFDTHKKFNILSNPCNANGISHFHIACVNNNTEAVEFFLKNGINVNETIKADSHIFPSYTSLHIAVEFAYPAVVDVLLKYGANMYLKNSNGLCPLDLIVGRDIAKCEIITSNQFAETLNILSKYTIKHDVESDKVTDDSGFYKYYMAYIFQDKSIIENVTDEIENINRLVNINSPFCQGYTALHFTAFSNVQIFKLLLEKGADIEAKNSVGLTPFDLCLQNFPSEDINSIILSKKDWKNIVLSDNLTKLTDIISALESVNKFFSFLDRTKSALTIHVPLDSPLWPGYTLLHFAVASTNKSTAFRPRDSFFKQEDNTMIIDECLKRGADITKADAKGSTPLHLAFYMQKKDVVEHFLKHHVTITANPADKDNLSHFHIACAADHLTSVEHFLSIGLNVNDTVNATFTWYTDVYKNKKPGTRHFLIHPGSTAAHIAAANGRGWVIKRLSVHMADVHAVDVNGFTAIHRLVSWGSYLNRSKEFIMTILERANFKNVTTDCGLSYLHVACYFNDCQAIKRLIKNGVDVKKTLVDTSDTKLTCYDEYFCRERGGACESIPFLLDFKGYTPLHFYWHGRGYIKDPPTFWKTSFLLLDTFGITEIESSLMQHLLKTNRFDKFYVTYATANKNFHLQKQLEEKFGLTILHLACCVADVKSVEKLIKSGANVSAKVHANCPDWILGLTPLHCAVMKAYIDYDKKKFFENSKKIIRLLIKNGADPFLVDENNQTPFHVIKCLERNIKRDRVINIYSLIANLFDTVKDFTVNPTDNQGVSVFHIACITLNKDVIKKFCNSGIHVNQAISDNSKYYPGRTALHLVIESYDQLNSSSIGIFSDEIVLQIIDMLIKYGANVNATDVIDETPLFKAVQSTKLRKSLIEKLISNGADVNLRNLRGGNTAFELYLMQGNANWNEINLFLDAGCHFNTFNPIHQEGYLAKLFRYEIRSTLGTDDVMEYPVLASVLNDSRTIEIISAGRTALHNVVSILPTYVKEDEHMNKKMVLRYDIRRFRIPWRFTKKICSNRLLANTTFKEHYAYLIDQLLIRGCEIDQEDDEGKTALHLAVSFNNPRAIIPLLNNGSDINLIDKYGKTAFAYFGKAEPNSDDPWYTYQEDYKYINPIYMHTAFVMHVYKLEFIGQSVSNQNKRLQAEVLKILGPIPDEIMNCFHDEMEKTKTINIGETNFSLYDFLINTNTDTVYMDMTIDERGEVDNFFENIRQYNFLEIECLMKLKYKQSIERTKLIEPALTSLNVLTTHQVPDLCCRKILKFLKNEDFKRLIASVV